MKRLLSFLFAVFMLITFTGVVSAAEPAQYGKVESYGLALQALKGKDGVTDLYVGVSPKTNDILAPNQLKKIQLKSFTEGGELVYTKNLFDVPAVQGLADVKLQDVDRNQPLQTQVHVKNAQTVDEEVLTGKTTVQLRPDLTVDSVHAADKVNVNVPFSVTADIKELNGDVGAKANVQVLDGDNVMDTAEGLVVEAGGKKQIVFMLTLAKAGKYTLKVNISGIEPGDYDNSNNDKTFSVEAVENKIPVYYLSHYGYSPDYEFYETSPTKEYHYKSENEFFRINIWTNDPISPLDVKLKLTSETGNSKDAKVSMAKTGNWGNGDDDYTYWNGYDSSTSTWAWAYQSPWGTELSVYQGAGHYSHNWIEYWDGGSSYFEVSEVYGGSMLGAKQSVSVNLDVTGQNDTHYGGNHTINLTPYSYSWDYSYYSWWYNDIIHYWGHHTFYSGDSSGYTSW